jgi:hypothetical protein
MASALVLKRFHLDPSAANGEFIEIHGRKPGLVAFLLAMIGIDPTTVFKCSAERIEVKQASVFGAQAMTIPLAAVTGIVGGHTKPVQYLAIAGVFFLMALGALTQKSFVAFIVLAVLGLLCGVAYMIKKQMGLHVQNGGDRLYGLEFNRSMIEGVDVDIARVNETIRLINGLVLQATSRSPASMQRAA